MLRKTDPIFGFDRYELLQHYRNIKSRGGTSIENNQVIDILLQIKSEVKSLHSTVEGIKTDIAGIKESVNRIEHQQQEDVLTILKVIDSKVTEINERQNETDQVIDVLSARTTRLQAKTEHLSSLDN
ncbi:hypothetical protein NQ117_12890 [Paenibacillus sp. SC116]|nr:hypothetical protein [Paenibacillus sp. SC116]